MRTGTAPPSGAGIRNNGKQDKMDQDYISYFRPGIDAMEGYTPGEQPKTADIVKLNTNESPFPPSPGVKRALLELDCERLRRYPDPVSSALREKIGAMNGCGPENIITGNGSDDLLTILTRCFTDERRKVISEAREWRKKIAEEHERRKKGAEDVPRLVSITPPYPFGCRYESR